MLFHQAQHRAKAAQDHAKAAQDQAKVHNKLALQAEKDNDAVQKELQDLKRVMDVSAVKGIFSSYSFLFFGAPGHYDMRKYSCWCKVCALVRGRGDDCVSRGRFLDVSGCFRSKLTVWKEDQFTVLVLGQVRCVGLCEVSGAMIH